MQRLRRAANLLKVREQDRARYRNNPEKRRDQMRRRRENNVDKVRKEKHLYYRRKVQHKLTLALLSLPGAIRETISQQQQPNQ